MFKIWLGVVLALVFQEFFSVAAALVSALRLDLNLWIIHGIWFAATVLEIALSYAAGLWVRKRFAHSRVGRWAERASEGIGHATGERGKHFLLFSLSFVLYVWMAGFIGAWMGISLEITLAFTLLGALAWYAFAWAAALGVNAVSPNFMTAAIVIVALGVVFTVALALVKKKKRLPW